jgi:hypothetical protein
MGDERSDWVEELESHSSICNNILICDHLAEGLSREWISSTTTDDEEGEHWDFSHSTYENPDDDPEYLAYLEHRKVYTTYYCPKCLGYYTIRKVYWVEPEMIERIKDLYPPDSIVEE